jgi:protein-L-isoaspartate(D-aspartate) O-methyltransferase
MATAVREHDADRHRMIKNIRRLAKAFARQGGPELSQRVLEVMSDVPRHIFLGPDDDAKAYADQPRPIGYGQTISQPFIVALMSSLARVEASDRVLEVGTGSGYQTAILARLAGHVFTVEIIEDLRRTAAERLTRLGAANVTCRAGDGHLGLPEQAPFDAIVVTAAPDTVPAALVEQLAPGGRLVIPTGGGEQALHVLEKSTDGRLTDRSIVGVRFVPLVHG